MPHASTTLIKRNNENPTLLSHHWRLIQKSHINMNPADLSSQCQIDNEKHGNGSLIIEKNRQVDSTNDNDLQEHVAGNVTELIGRTPLIEINHITRKEGALARVVAKLEGLQPCHSVKDRIALPMIIDAENRGLIVPGVTTLVEPTGGNTGISLAFVGRQRGYKVILVMPAHFSLERRMLMRALGADIIITEPTKDLEELLQIVHELLSTIPNSHCLNQLENPMNPEAHFRSTGPEIWRDTAGKVEVLVAGCGTGGTISGAGRYLKSKNPDIKIIAVEPTESPVLSGGEKGQHSIQGIGPGFVPKVTDRSVIDEIVTVSSKEAFEFTQQLMKEEGLLVGISSGAAAAAAIKVSKRPENAGKLIVVILPSAAERYLSTDLFASIRRECKNLIVI